MTTATGKTPEQCTAGTPAPPTPGLPVRAAGSPVVWTRLRCSRFAYVAEHSGLQTDRDVDV